MATENEEQEAKGPGLETAGHGDEVPRSESREHNEPAGQQARGRGSENSSSTSSSVDASENATTEGHTPQLGFLHQETSRDRSLSARGGNEPYNFTSGEDGSGNLLKPCLKLTSVDFNRDHVIGMNILEQLLSRSEIPWTLYFDTSNINDFEVRYYRRSYDGASSTEKQLDLTKNQEKEVKIRAKGHWICHVCKQIDGEIILNHEERPCSRFDKCRHPLKGCKDCPSRGSDMYEELLEYFRDEIRKEIREGKRRR
ncbi:hypothetical protein V8E51_018100 [Hyaloscypha variabilis]